MRKCTFYLPCVVILYVYCLQSPRRLLHMYESWEPLTRFFERRGERVLASQTISTFQSTIEKLYLPHVRRAISNDWKAFQESEVCVLFLPSNFKGNHFSQISNSIILKCVCLVIGVCHPNGNHQCYFSSRYLRADSGHADTASDILGGDPVAAFSRSTVSPVVASLAAIFTIQTQCSLSGIA